MSAPRPTPPEIRWNAVLAGGAVALGSGVLLFYALGPGLRAVAEALALALGALLAGRLSRDTGALHGGLVAVLWIAAEALSDPFFPGATDPLADTALTVVTDAVRIGLGVAFGWLGGRTARG